MKTLRLLLTAAACALLAGQAGALITDLGGTGNAAVSSVFDSYKSARPSGACRAQGPGKRVILTGYGLFAGRGYNISGEVVSAMADPAFWPADLLLSEPGAFPDGQRYERRLTPGQFSNGAVARNRSLSIDGQPYQVCFLALNVAWDLAAAILVYEAGFFRPDMIMMTGGGAPEARFEGAAINTPSQMSGYDSAGVVDKPNTPVSDWLLQDYPPGHELATTWDGPRLASGARTKVGELGYTVSAPSGQSPGNDYICNNIAFVALHAAVRNEPTRLAGSAAAGPGITLPALNLRRGTIVGFFHFPDIPTHHPDLASYGGGIYGWAQVLATAIHGSLGSAGGASAPAARGAEGETIRSRLLERLGNAALP